MKEFFHTDFKLNGQPFAYDELFEVAYSLIKEGTPYEREAGDFLMDWCDDKEYIVQHTSGSTGTPKRIQLSKRLLVHSAKATGQALDLPAGTRALNPLSCSVIGGKMMLVRALVLGWDLHLVPPASQPLKDTALAFDFAAMVPLQLKASLDQIHRIDTLIVGGAPISPEILSALPADQPKIWQTYGMTETGSHIALRRLTPVPPGSDPETVLPPFKTLGDIRVSQTEQGCLRIHFPEFFETPIETHDTVVLESDTAFRWVGRADNIVNSGGVKLHPELLEARMASLLSQRFFLAGLEDASLGEKLVLVVEGNGDANRLSRQLRDSRRFTKYELPREIYTVPEFVENRGGKVDREASLKASSLLES